MRRTLSTALGLLLVFPFTASAHKMWVLPSETVVNGPDPLITVDAAISNDLFYFNHVPLPLDGLKVMAPDGTTVPATNQAKLKYRSVFDVALPQKGTYRITVPMAVVLASWDENGQKHMWRGSKEEAATKIPAEAKDLKVMESVNRVETFVTNGKPTTKTLEPTGKGIELVPITHPNDLFATETAKFRLVIDGKPAAGLEVTIVQGGTRYRDDPRELRIKTDEKGEFSVQWPEAGMYWLEASITDKQVEFPRSEQRLLRYAATLEVLPR